MKTIKYLLVALTVCALLSCSKDDAPLPPKQTPPPGGTTPPTETPLNKAPGAFDLIDMANGDDGIDLKPTFSWQAAVDPEAEAVTYNLYLDEQEEPTTLVGANLTEPNYTATDSLHLVTDYHWKVVAKDPKGATVSSAVNSFTTRTLNFPDDPVTDNAGFSGRSGHSMVPFKDKLWVIGGYGDEGPSNDVWTSGTGENWKKVSPDSDHSLIRDLFSPRADHAVVVFDNKLWVIGGFGTGGNAKNDVWYSTDGTSWTEATPNAAFLPRSDHTAVAYNNKLWIIGGSGQDIGTYYNDVWSSTDGVTWKVATANASFSPRSRHNTVVFQDKIWVLGGSLDRDGAYNDVWSSSDGINWTEVTLSTPFPASGIKPAPVIFDDKIMLLGIWTNKVASSDIWYSHDGKNWSVMKPTGDFPILDSPLATLFKNKIWFNNSGSKEIWALD